MGKTTLMLDLISQRQRALGSNVANVDTPGYVRKDINFSTYLGSMNSPIETKLSTALGPSGVIEDRREQEIDIAEKDYIKAETQMSELTARIAELEEQLENIENETASLITEFEKKYVRFIQEASWLSEDYTDDNLYYIDAEMTLHKSAQPKVSYTINVIDISQLEEYKDYVFDLGDITYIQDPDFFGWKDKAKFTPYKEGIVITETSTFFHSPEKCTIKAQIIVVLLRTCSKD
jgi:flagellar basal-body rod protein FlgB